MRKRNKNINLAERSHKFVKKKRHKNVNFGDKKSQTSVKMSQKCKFMR